ncbi:MAG: hypothetical protein A2511_03895 [Deltaproteobacteria bacterium RIFOXYD12_FULL_50_9]|nr:MAG: hypothetical protein A2511_03895 [Deltaproteobacteria bacterium RIFOXYD12_FULL_50_9]
MRLTPIKQNEPLEQTDIEHQAHSLGSRLRQAREVKGLTIEQISTSTRISVSILTALESNDPEKLPSAIACRAFVKIYGELLGLDIAELLALLAKTDQKKKQHSAPSVTSTKLLQSESFAEKPILLSGKQVLPAIFVIILLFISFMIYRVYFADQSPETLQETKTISEPPARKKLNLQNPAVNNSNLPALQPEKPFQRKTTAERQQPPLPLPTPLPRQNDTANQPSLSPEISSSASSHQGQAAEQNTDKLP